MNQLQNIPLTLIIPDPDQPRTHFDEEKLAELAASIAEHDVRQPIEVSPIGDGRYLIHHGERRWRASQMAKRDTIPAIVAQPIEDDAKRLLLGIIENVQREDLNAIDEARSYARLMELGMSKAEIARQVGKSLPLINGRMLWLEMDDGIQELVADGRLPKDGRVAKALLAIPSDEARLKLATRAASSGISIKNFIPLCARVAKEMEQAARKADDGKPTGVPMMDIARQAMNGNAQLPDATKFGWAAVRATAVQMCKECALNDPTRGVPEPAWALMKQIAGATCGECDVEGDLQICRGCPGVTLLQKLVAVPAVKGGARV